MAVGVAPRIDSLYLSKGVNFLRNVRLGKEYAASAKAQIVVSDDAGIELAKWDGTVLGYSANFNRIAGADSIPHGAKYVLTLTQSNGDVINVSYGTVVRGDHRYPLIPAADTTNTALQFADTFDREYVGRYWVPRGKPQNAITIHKNPMPGIPNSLGPDFAFWKDAGVLWYAPMNSDSVTINTSLITVGNGRCTVVVCSDYSMSTWLGVQFTTALFDRCAIVRGTSPTVWEDVPGGPNVKNTVQNFDNYTIKFNAQSRTIQCFKNDSSTPLVSWKDTNFLIPTGAGYRYVGLVWNTTLATPGAEPISWSAKDGI